jgi:hypothetical protein
MIAVIVVAVGCGKSDETGEPERRPGNEQSAPSKSDDSPPPKRDMVVVDMSPGGIDAVIQAPGSASVEQKFGNAVIRTPDGAFHLEIGAEWADIEARKKDIASNTLNRLVRFVVDEPTAVVYESKVAGTSEFHVLANAMAGEARLSCEDSKGPAYSESSAMAMLEACRSISGKP